MHDYRVNFCTCTFIDKMFVIRGCDNENNNNWCLQLDTSDCSRTEVARMNEVRSDAACANLKKEL